MISIFKYAEEGIGSLKFKKKDHLKQFNFKSVCSPLFPFGSARIRAHQLMCGILHVNSVSLSPTKLSRLCCVDGSIRNFKLSFDILDVFG